GVAVRSGIREDCETEHLLAANDVVVRAARGVRTLGRQEPVVVSIICTAFLGVPLVSGIGDEFAERTPRLTVLHLPIKPVLLPLAAAALLRIRKLCAYLRIAAVILALRGMDSEDRRNCRE